MALRGRPRHPDVLTPREWDVFDLLRRDCTNEQIAAELGITLDGAKYHVSSILSKLGVTSRIEAANWQPSDTVPGGRNGWAFLPALLRGLGLAMAAATIIGVGVLGFGVFMSRSGEDVPEDSSQSVLNADDLTDGGEAPEQPAGSSLTPTPITQRPASLDDESDNPALVTVHDPDDTPGVGDNSGPDATGSAPTKTAEPANSGSAATKTPAPTTTRPTVTRTPAPPTPCGSCPPAAPTLTKTPTPGIPAAPTPTPTATPTPAPTQGTEEPQETEEPHESEHPDETDEPAGTPEHTETPEPRESEAPD
jgi:DNA-binding CsgD family transcriptional regulator